MKCTLCPRMCGAEREKSHGYCLADDKIKIAKVMVHHWEEPPISGTRGSGAVFFSCCPLKCVYCQNKEISQRGYGHNISVTELADEFLKLQSKGVHNINLVSPTQYADKIRDALDLVRGELKIPVVYNTGGYELSSEIEKMSRYVDIFLTDIKYYSPELSKRYSYAPDYYKRASEALGTMLSLRPECVIDDDGIMKSGVILRHLVLPGCRHDSIKILEDVAEKYGTDRIKLSLMSQYTPDFCEDHYPEIKRKLTTFEYDSVVKHSISLGYDGYIQERASATSIYTPDFTKGDEI